MVLGDKSGLSVCFFSKIKRYTGFIGVNGGYGLFSFLSITVNRVLKIVSRRPDGVPVQNTTGIKKPGNPCLGG